MFAVAAAAAGALKAALPALPEAELDNGVFRPEAKGEGVGWRDEKAPNALEGFIGGFLVGLLDEVVLDQSMPAKSSIVTLVLFGLPIGESRLRNIIQSEAHEHIRYWETSSPRNT